MCAEKPGQNLAAFADRVCKQSSDARIELELLVQQGKRVIKTARAYMQKQKTLAAHYTVEAQPENDTYKVYQTQGSFEEEMQNTVIVKLRDKNCSKKCW